MIGTALRARHAPQLPNAILETRQLKEALRALGPPLLFGVRLWASVCLALYVAFWLELDNPSWAGTSAALMCQPQLGASLRKGWFRMIGTLIGAVAIVVMTACFPQDRGSFLLGLALWGTLCALVATLLRNFAAFPPRLALGAVRMRGLRDRTVVDSARGRGLRSRHVTGRGQTEAGTEQSRSRDRLVSRSA